MDYEKLLDLVKLEPIPKGQLFVANYLLKPLYKFRKLKIVFEGIENLPNRPVIFVMNHTDRYNYWPFQFQLYMLRNKIMYCYTTTWVKLKYYESKLLARFFNWTGNLPMPSKGYLMVKDLQKYFGDDKSILNKYFRKLKSFINGELSEEELNSDKKFLSFIRNFGDYKKYLEERYKSLMTKAYHLCHDAIYNKNLNLLIFPEGTRSKKLIKGKTGAVQFAFSLNVPIVPVGCNGSDKVYTRNAPWIEKNKTIIYRIGKPIYFNQINEFKLDTNFIPFTEKAEKNKNIFEKATEYMMEKLAELLDDEYKPSNNTLEKYDINKFIL
ncbi:1-acyl-sn-glycerol-3-phosphate acyltransferase [Deferribacter autotrophicus]|uniref:1-acyl-sn-glycerol-3-phosphate acyltransferase n=1 Tax=Deferribacter autotrophicus TaxID=500465 RepID=A0A5A8F3K7_9BACT|nr:lysophospholipid acyltransferase family protein [Deferribacter autotrophicus]KAA0258784.1 1-acyl-sn-glycerol-3-phosphate acyltransferase [Deferribacter autotrophicus]